MSDTTTYPFKRGQFVCSDCSRLFFAAPEDIVFEEEAFRTKCEECGGMCDEPHWMRNLHKTLGTAKGGAMSQEGRDKSRLNGFKTGSALLIPGRKGRIPMAPAKPGGFPECDACQDLDECKDLVEEALGTCRPVYCHRKGEVRLKYISAFLDNDPEKLRALAAENAADMQMVFNSAIKDIFKRGTEIVEAALLRKKDGTLIKDDDGAPYMKQTIYAHPLIKQCVNIMATMGFGLGEWTMTPRSREQKDKLEGFLAGMGVGAGKSLEEVTEGLQESMDKFTGAMHEAQEMRSKDRALGAFNAETVERGEHG